MPIYPPIYLVHTNPYIIFSTIGPGYICEGSNRTVVQITTPAHPQHHLWPATAPAAAAVAEVTVLPVQRSALSHSQKRQTRIYSPKATARMMPSTHIHRYDDHHQHEPQQHRARPSGKVTSTSGERSFHFPDSAEHCRTAAAARKDFDDLALFFHIDVQKSATVEASPFILFFFQYVWCLFSATLCT